MIVIKFIKDTKTNRKDQVIKGDFKILNKQVKLGNAVLSDEKELENYKNKFV